MSYLHETFGVSGAYEALQQIERSRLTRFSTVEVRRLMTDSGVSDTKSLLQDFVGANVLHHDGERFALTRQAVRTCLLLEAINGGDLKDIYRRLGQLDSTLVMYELIREGMTKTFLRNINDRPGFLRLYICSPWIHLDKKQAGLLTH